MAATAAQHGFGTRLLIGDGSAGAAKTISTAPTGAARSSNMVTITTTTTHSMVADDIVVIAGVSDSTFNGTFVVFDVPLTTTIRYRQVGANTTSGSGTATKQEHGNAVAELKAIPFPALKRDTLDVTHMGSPDTYREYLTGMADADAVTMNGNYTSETYQDQLKTDLDAGTKRTFAVVWPGTLGSWVLSAIVAGLDNDGQFDSPLGFSVTLKPVGKPTLNPAQ